MLLLRLPLWRLSSLTLTRPFLGQRKLIFWSLDSQTSSVDAFFRMNSLELLYRASSKSENSRKKLFELQKRRSFQLDLTLVLLLITQFAIARKEISSPFVECELEFRCNHWTNRTNFGCLTTESHAMPAEIQTEFDLWCFSSHASPQIGFSITANFRWWNYFDICCKQIELKECDCRVVSCRIFSSDHSAAGWPKIERKSIKNIQKQAGRRRKIEGQRLMISVECCTTNCGARRTRFCNEWAKTNGINRLEN